VKPFSSDADGVTEGQRAAALQSLMRLTNLDRDGLAQKCASNRSADDGGEWKRKCEEQFLEHSSLKWEHSSLKKELSSLKMRVLSLELELSSAKAARDYVMDVRDRSR
jgi:hypothetical protein